jgi:hypothetical protein
MKKLGFLFGILLMTSGIIISQTQSELFNIVFHHDFENNTPGDYRVEEWRADWNYPPWANHDIGYGDIIEENGNKVLRESFPPGTFELDDAGVQWLAPIGGYDELYLTFRVKFSSGFTNSNLQGKLPGLSGGTAIGGGFLPRGNDGWSARFMFHGYNTRFYLYYPDLYKVYGDSEPVEGKKYYGEAVCLDFDLHPGVETWFYITQRIVMNTPGKTDGLVEGYINGKLAARKTGIRWRDIPTLQIEQLYIANFLGGSGEPSSTMEYIYYDDFYVYYYKDGVDVPRGHETSPYDRVLILPGSEQDVQSYDDSSTTVETKLPSKPENLIAEYNENNSVTLSWDSSRYNPEKYYIAYATGYYKAFVILDSVFVPTTSYTDFNLSNDTVRYYKVCALNNYGKTEYGNIVNVKIDKKTVNNPPSIEDQNFTIIESKLTTNLLGELTASDPDDNQTLTYSIISGNEENIFYLDSKKGELRLNNLQAFNFNYKREYTLTVEIKDDGLEPLKDNGIITLSFIPEMLINHIDPTNSDDQYEDGSIAHPYDSWHDVNWTDDTYYLQKCGTQATESKINIYASNVTIGSYGEGEKPIILSTATDFALRAFEKSNITIQNLNITADEAIACIYILGSSCDNNIIENCHLANADNGIRIIDGKTVTARYNTFSDNTDAIYSYAETTNVYYNVFKDNYTGINISSSASSSEIYNNVFYDNSRGVSTSYSSLTIYNNIFYLSNKGDQAINHSMDKLVSDNNIFYPEQDGFLDIGQKKYSTLSEFQTYTGLDLNSFTSDPLFQDVYNDNFNVDPESQAVDAGKSVGILMDFYGYNVPYGNAPDIGLIECLEENDNISTSFKSFIDEGSMDSPLIYPNPSNGKFKISFSLANNQYYELHIQDVSGNLIYKDIIDTDGNDLSADIDISHVSKGMYLVFLLVDDKIYTQRILIN